MKEGGGKKREEGEKLMRRKWQRSEKMKERSNEEGRRWKTRTIKKGD